MRRCTMFACQIWYAAPRPLRMPRSVLTWQRDVLYWGNGQSCTLGMEDATRNRFSLTFRSATRAPLLLSQRPRGRKNYPWFLSEERGHAISGNRCYDTCKS